MVMAEYVPRNRTPIKVGFYDIVRTIGRGNFAVVKLARHRITKTEVAIKIIDKSRLDQLNLKKIYREIQILKLLNHQHIIKLYQVMETSSTIYLVCEYARNGELFDYITEQGKLPEDKAKRMFWQVLIAVEYCHKNNVVHRDLKAENLLLDSSNNIKLADFGFSNFYQSGNMLSTWCGSPPYAAPEVFEGKLYDGPHLDVWSLGVVLYVLVCGTFPFDGSNLATLKDRVLGGRFRIPYWMSQDCENLVRHMLVINPKKRLTIAQIKKHKWMQECNPTLVMAQAKSSPHLKRRGKLSEYNEHVLKIMQNLRIDRQKTLESLNLSAYDHLYAIYHLLADRLKLHRTSFPLDGKISYDGERRRPSNVAEQALSSMTHATPTLPVHHEFSTTTEQRTQEKSGATSDVQFDDMTTGLPFVQHTLAAPVRYASPPLPQIRTSIYEESSNSENANVPYETPSNPSYMTCQTEESVLAPINNPQNSQFLTTDYHQRNVDMEEPNLGNYNLQQRRHTLMVPNLSQIQMLRSGLGSGDGTSPQLSPHTSTMKLNKSGEEMTQTNFTESFFPSFNGSSMQNCDGVSCNKPMCGCKHANTNLSSNQGNLLLPCKNLPASPDFNFTRNRMDLRPQLRRKSGVPGLQGNMGFNRSERVGEQFNSPEAKAAFIMTQRRQLDSSPIGFREGRRASDGLLLLGDNMLKEHLQKLARTKAVPEMTSENSEDTWESEGSQTERNHLAVPNQVNRTNSSERNASQPQSSPSTTPVGSGSNISYQPYNNNQSLARRRSLQAQHIQAQLRNTSPTVTQQHEAVEPPVMLNSCQPTVTRIPSPLLQDAADCQKYIQVQSNQEDGSCQWSSWKPVQNTIPPEGNTDVSPSMWQQLSKMKSGGTWKEGDLSKFAVASDEAVSSKVAAAQQDQQRDTKPLRQQSLPITPTSTNHPFGHPQSMAQILQQRRLQRRLKAATHQQQLSGYPLPLPELEQLRIDNAGALGRLQNIPCSPVIESVTQNMQPVQRSGEHEWVANAWGNTQMQYETAVPTTDLRENLYANERISPVAFSQHEMKIFPNAEHSDGFPYQGFSSHGIAPSTVPLSIMDTKSGGQFSWSYHVPTFYRKSFELNESILNSENLSNSADRLEQANSEAMEFAMY